MTLSLSVNHAAQITERDKKKADWLISPNKGSLGGISPNKGSLGGCSNSRDQMNRSGLQYNDLAMLSLWNRHQQTLSLLSLRMQNRNEPKMDASREVGGLGREGMLLIGWNVSADCEVEGQSLLNVN